MKARIGRVTISGVTWRGCSGQTPFMLATRHPAEFTNVTEFVVVRTADGVEATWWTITGPILTYFQPEGVFGFKIKNDVLFLIVKAN